ncbi:MULTISPECIES: 4'-phosphopantetheinyl transferase family protein [Paenibacillus]|uniref:4'-phosphopantetheinyl transferase family protein n=1 Tax=Paenibacillus TaxID=44249 RepID=UPI001642CD1B|nr:4'-phosphopantetheinyl transferase superfamily protein [Paenibacillus sp. Y412MC10]
MNIGAIRLSSPISNSDFQQAYARADLSRQRKIEAYLHQKDKERSLVGDMLTRLMLFRQFGYVSLKAPFTADRFGKPYLEGQSGMHFNISHAGDWIVCAVDSSPIGIDVELIRTIDMAIAHHYFSDAEQESLKAVPPENRLSYFFDLWTLKESYIKAIGKGLSEPLRFFTIDLSAHEIKLISPKKKDAAWKLHQYEIDRAYKLSICAANDNFPNQVTEVVWDELLSFYMEER